MLRPRRVSWRRLLSAGLVAALAVAAGGFLLEWRRFGRDTPGAVARAEADVRGRFEDMSALLGRVASAIASDPAAAEALQAGSDAAKSLFDVVDRHSLATVEAADIAVTVYDKFGSTAAAWAGRPSDNLPGERVRGPRAWFVTQSALGLRLVHVLPIGSDDRRLGVVAVEHPLSPAPAGGTIALADYELPTTIGPASLRMQYEGAGDQPRPNSFPLHAPDGDALLEASFSEAQVAAARTDWRRAVGAAVVLVCAVTVLLLVGPLLDRRAASKTVRRYSVATAAAAALIVAGAALIWLALSLGVAGGPDRYEILVLFAGTAAGLIALFAAPVFQLAASMRADRQRPSAHRVVFVLQQLIAGTGVALIVAAFARVLRTVLDDSAVDLRHFSLHPWSEERLMLLGGILLCHLATLWGGSLLLVAAGARWRIRRLWRGEAVLALFCWILPAGALGIVAVSRQWALPVLGLMLSVTICALAALSASQVSAWFRHATVAGRILALFVAFLLPSLLLYPSVNFFTDRNVRGIIATRYAPEARDHAVTLQDRLAVTRHEIDALFLVEYLQEASELAEQSGTQRPETAFAIWRQTVLARERLTSAVELYDASGTLVSRFPLNLPEYAVTAQPAGTTASCQQWDVFGEVQPFGSDERRMLHAHRPICSGNGADARVLGTIVVHIVPDYRTLPFITSQSPYFEVFRSSDGAPHEGITGSEVNIVIYGWGLTPLYASGSVAWPITDELFTRVYGSRGPFWTTMGRGDGRWHVYVSNDRSAIYAIGYPALTLFDRLVHVAELTTLAGTSFLLVLVATALFTRAARERPRVGRALLREIRASFYRKLFLAFVLASIIPVLILALVIRAYFAGLLLANIEAEAARSASIAQRVIEESAAYQQRAGQAVAKPTDDTMILISQVIDQDVNVFEGPQLVASSKPDLFASGLLPRRTPHEVYRGVVLQRMPSFVGEDRIGAFPYMVAAAPVRAGGDFILTVPLANQQREIEREIDELDRGVHLAALCFILLGAGIGLSMAERIADPVRRLTRATRRIARGDFDERIAVKSADELRRLVDAFNSMAAELKAQRAQLERTHRLEAWAEMARQVAHEIKNPLTPIQLSAEHLRRVHADRGEPLGAVLEGCVTSILGQVRLLRQISSEFSNFASSPTARPASVDLVELVTEIVEPYRQGLAGRIEIRNHVSAPLPRVFVDRTLVGRALSNIVENALHAMPGQGLIELTSMTEPDFVVLRARDTGAGMDEDALARVFEPYFSTKATGTGLGLPIARRNIELSGGQIAVASVKGEGTTVTLRLPIAPAT